MKISMLLTTLVLATAAAFSGTIGREARSKPVAAATVAVAAAAAALGDGGGGGGAMVSRTAFVAGMMTGAILAPSLAFAKEKEECKCEEVQNKRGCMDVCLYECIKHGGGKEECIADCTNQCKTVKGQRTMATPLTEKGVDYQ